MAWTTDTPRFYDDLLLDWEREKRKENGTLARNCYPPIPFLPVGVGFPVMTPDFIVAYRRCRFHYQRRFLVCNLVLLGRHENNSLTYNIAPRHPFLFLPEVEEVTFVFLSNSITFPPLFVTSYV